MKKQNCFVCGDEYVFGETCFTVGGNDVKNISVSGGAILRLCPKCQRLLYLSYGINPETRTIYPDGAFVEGEVTK